MARHRDPTDAPPAKRQKVDVACDMCRSKKIKCDSVRPVCGPCMKRSDTSSCCSWEGGHSRHQQPSLAEVLRLRKRIEELESDAVIQGDKPSNNNNNNPNTPPNNAPNIPPTNRRNNNNNNDVEASEIQTAPRNDQYDVEIQGPAGLANAGLCTGLYSSPQNPTAPISPPLTRPWMENPPTTEKVSSQPASESNQSMGSLSGDRHFFGAPSAISFLNQMRNAVQQKFGINDPTILPNRDDLQTAILGMKSTGTQRYKQIDYVLPGRRKADKLLSMYWETVHPLYPFLGKQTFLAQYETLWVTQKGDRDDPIFLCSLNLIFAISSQLDEDISPNERQSSANGFFERAKESLDLWHLNTLQSVQMLLLLSIHLQSLCYLNQSWMIIGVAIRTAQSLGLHLCETSKRIVSQRERELVRKVWHTCVLLDRMVSMNYGRPSMITASRDAKAPLPLPVDEELLTTKDCPPMAYPNQPSTVEFFVQSLRLFDILDEVLVRFHPDHLEKGYSIEEMLEKFLGRTAAGNNWSILDIDRRLLKWEKDLPAHLKIEYTSLDWGVSRTFSRQGVLLRQRYLHIRLLSLSPLLSAYLCSESGETSNELSLSERIAVQCSVLCVKIAQEMIELGYGRRPADPNSVGLTSTWWNYVLPIYSAATVLIAARLSPSILSEISEDSILQSWSCAIDILKSYQVFNPMIQRCLSALELIYRVIPERYSNPRLQSQHYGADADEARSISFQPQSHTTGVLSQELPYAGPPIGENAIDSLVGNSGDDILDNNLLFGMNDFSWLNVVPFESYPCF